MKKTLLFVFALICLMTVLCVSVGATPLSGQAVDAEWIAQNEGSNTEYEGDLNDIAPNYRIHYELDPETGILRIYHKDTQYKTQQEMLPYARVEWIPWLKSDLRPYVTEVHIEEDVLRVGQYSFYNCEYLKTVYLPSTVYKIDKYTFYGCENLEKIYYPGSQETFEKYVHFDKAHNEYAIDKFVFGESVTIRCKNQHGEVFKEYIVGGYNAGDAYEIVPMVFDGMTLAEGEKTKITGEFLRNDQTVYEFLYDCNHEYTPDDVLVPCKSDCKYCNHKDPENKHVFAGYDGTTVPCAGVCMTCHEPYTFENGEHTFDSMTDGEDDLCLKTCTRCNTSLKNENGKHQKEKVKKGGTLFAGKEEGWICKICGENEIEQGTAPIIYIAAIGASVLAGVVIFLAVYLPIRKRKKIKKMTW